MIAEIWTLFEGSLQLQAKRLVEDIAKQQNADSKALWAKVKPQIKIRLLDSELEENSPSLCSFPIGVTEGAVRLRCRAPCLLGFSACPRHCQTAQPSPIGPSNSSTGPSVDRIYDSRGCSYFVDKHGIARDRNGIARGQVDEGVLMLFEATQAKEKEALNESESEE